MARQVFNISFDTRYLDKGLKKLDKEIDEWWKEAREQMGDSLLVLSSEEVPHDKGVLQASGNVNYDRGQDSVNVSYNTKYAAYVHEGMRKDGSYKIRNYGKGRKKKYLEDPLKNNLSKWQKIGKDYVSKKLSGKI